MADSAPPSPKRRRRPWWIWLVAVAVIMAVSSVIFGHDAIKTLRRAVAGHYSQSAADHMAKDEWPAAVQDIYAARRWDPEAPAVLRVLADFLSKTRGDVFSLHHLLLRLETAGHATIEDRLKIGEFQLTQGDVERARATLEALPPAEREKRRAQELLANILRVEGRAAESEQVMRRALMADPTDSAAQFRLALLDYQTPFAEIRARTRDRLWQIAAGGDDAALQAIQFLSGDASLNGPQADELMALLEKHPKPSASARFKVLSAQMRLRPERRDAVLTQQVAGFDAEGAESSAFLQWLLDEKEYDRLLKLLPDQIGSSQALLEFRLKALAGAERWEEVEKLLSAKDLPLPTEVANLWRSRAAHRIHADPARTQHYLTAAFNAAGQGEKGEVTLETARFAEECGLWRMAGACYKGIARAHPTAQIRMLEKAHEMALRDRDSTAALESARFLAEQSPANQSFGNRHAYLQLILGEDLELAVTRCETRGTALLRALAAYRWGDLPTMKRHLSGISESDLLTPGERAVYAGLLASGGEQGPAYQVAEKVPVGLLLPEELVFLKRAL